MLPPRHLATNLLALAGEALNRTFVLPLLFFSPTSRCNSRCLSCDWWRASGEDDLTLDEIRAFARSLRMLRPRMIVVTGGEPLVREEFASIAALLRNEVPQLWLLTSGVLLAEHAEEVARLFARVTISLDGSDAGTYRRVRGIDALGAVEAGVARLKALAPGLRVTARATLHKENYRELPALADKARAMGLDQISFLAADLTSAAFGRNGSSSRAGRLALDHDDIETFRSVVAECARSHRPDFASGFIAESPARLARLPEYYAALLGETDYPGVDCNAPWISVVVEANGTVRPCFFHEPVGNIREAPLPAIVARDLARFRQGLDVRSNPVCQRCVCSLKLGWRSRIW
jgi:MoaA/NifB/PqqE/SkfB family radical SAM enzyme